MKITSKEKKFKKYVEHLLVARSHHGVLENEADFLAGASAVFAFMNRMDLVSPMWVFCPMSGRDMVKELIGKNTKINWLIDNNNDCPAHCR
tara:strand:+ start:429 stop:701 length:273 start_codon:yes stop_codon:yes gene_type:complete